MRPTCRYKQYVLCTDLFLFIIENAEFDHRDYQRIVGKKLRDCLHKYFDDLKNVKPHDKYWEKEWKNKLD